VTSPKVRIQEGSGPLVDKLPFSDGEFQRRLANTRRAMARQDLAAFISFTPENIYYLTARRRWGCWTISVSPARRWAQKRTVGSSARNGIASFKRAWRRRAGASSTLLGWWRSSE